MSGSLGIWFVAWDLAKISPEDDETVFDGLAADGAGLEMVCAARADVEVRAGLEHDVGRPGLVWIFLERA